MSCYTVYSTIQLALYGALALSAVGASRGQEQYPPPLKHTPGDHPADVALIVDIAGLHARDLDRWVREHPDSALGGLSARGDSFTNAWLPANDPVVGLLALATAGTPISTGIPATTFYARDLAPMQGNCDSAGTFVDLSRNAAASGQVVARDPARGCSPVEPHELLPYNTIFDLVKARGGTTAWAGSEERLVDLLRGHKGTGLSEAVVVISQGDGHATDEMRVASVKRWIESSAPSINPPPALIGITLDGFDAVERTPAQDANYSGRLTPHAEQALRQIDERIAELVLCLRQKGLFKRTWILVTATHLFAPAKHLTSRHFSTTGMEQVLRNAGMPAANISVSDGCLVWLPEGKQADVAANALWRERRRLGIASIRTSNELALTTYAHSARSPDLVLEPEDGVLWTDHWGNELTGGSSEDTRHAAMLVSGEQLGSRMDPTLVPTTQAAALLLRALGLEKLDLDAQHHEHAPALPGIF